MLFKLLMSVYLTVVGPISWAFYGDIADYECEDELAKMENLPEALNPNLCSSLDARHVKFNIVELSRGECKNLVMINGELHKMDPNKRLSVYEASSAFPLRLVETAWDLDKVKGNEEINKIAAGWKENNKLPVESAYSEWVRFHEYQTAGIKDQGDGNFPVIDDGSAIKDLGLDPGIHVTYDDQGNIEAKYHYGYPNEKEDELKRFFENLDNLPNISHFSCEPYGLNSVGKDGLGPVEYVGLISNLIGKPGFPPVLIKTEFGELDDYSKLDCTVFSSKSCQDYIFTERDKRFAKNINAIVRQLPCGVPLSVTAGEDHIKGITKNLQGYGFKNKSEKLSNASYSP
jgi:hypothetical protein